MERTSPPAGSKEERRQQRKAASRAFLSLSLPLMLSVVGTVLVLSLMAPVYALESALYVLFIVSPATVLVFMQMQDLIARQQERLTAFGKKPVWPHLAAVVVGLTLAFVSIDIGLLYNRFGDTHEGEPMRALVQSKYVSYGKHRITYHNVRIVPPVPSPLPFKFFETKSILLNPYDYARVIEGESEIELQVHKGALGLPWYERGRNAIQVVGKVAKDTPPTTNQPLPKTTVSAGLLREACLWKKNFDVDQEIPNRTPTGYRRDFWPNGAPRSVEPQVNGRNHGIGHYTFANGATYAAIPWKDGKKHGVVTLYREDGTREQELSYFQGALFGLQQWFDQQGRLNAEYLYIDNTTPLAASQCDGIAPNLRQGGH